jgi:RNA polymerase sigma-70 factor (ECF subfamily)
MLKVCQGQLEQLGLLFERYHLRLYNFFLRTTFDQDLSSDLTQQVFERIIKYKHSYKENSPFKAWFYQIARNVQHDHFKKQKINLDSLDKVHSEKNIKFADYDHENIEKEERLKILYSALDKLPHEKREILVLSQLEEMEYKDLAKLFNISENLVRVRVHRALQALKEVVQKYKL